MKQTGTEKWRFHSQVTDSRRAVLQKVINTRPPQNEKIFFTKSELARFSKRAKFLGITLLL
jgi:hypothetical protein